QKFEYPFAPAQDQNLALKFLLGNTASSPGGPHTVSIANVVLEVKDAPVKRPPALTADSTDNKVGQSIRITFRDDAAWRPAITAVKIDGEVIDSSRYTVEAGALTLTADHFIQDATYLISVEADGYMNTSVSQV